MTLSEKLGATNYFPRIYVEVRLISPKPAQVFVRRELQLFNTYGTVFHPNFCRPGATDLQFYCIMQMTNYLYWILIYLLKLPKDIHSYHKDMN